MDIQHQINTYIESLSEPKNGEMLELHQLIIHSFPACRLWFEDGKNNEGKTVANPNIGYGFYTIQYANGTTKPFFQIGLSANKSGISVYILGLKDKTYIAQKFGEKLGKAIISGYCIKFKTIKDIHIDVLIKAIQYGFETSNNQNVLTNNKENQ